MLKRGQLRQFLAVVETGSFTSAAVRLHVSQPSLSSGIAELERVVGTPLFIRERRNLRLTEAGNRLLPHARTIEREFRVAEAVAEGTAPTPQTLRVGVLPTIATSLVTGIVQGYRGVRPITIFEGLDGELRRRIAEGQLDAALTKLRDGDGVQHLLEEPYLMMLPAGHRLADRQMLRAEELSGETMIARRSCEVLRETSGFFTSRGVRPRFSYRSSNDDRCMAFVRSGVGLTTAPKSHAGPGLVARRLDGYELCRRLGLITSPTGFVSNEVSELLSVAERTFAEHASSS